MTAKEKQAAYMRQWLASCPERRKRNKERAVEWAKNNKDKAAATKRRRDLKKRYGITPEQWDAIFITQGSRCAICKTADAGKRQWHTDHCHTSGKVRGILCMRCNALLGYAKDNVTTLYEAITYLERGSY